MYTLSPAAQQQLRLAHQVGDWVSPQTDQAGERVIEFSTRPANEAVVANANGGDYMTAQEFWDRLKELNSNV